MNNMPNNLMGRQNCNRNDCGCDRKADEIRREDNCGCENAVEAIRENTCGCNDKKDKDCGCNRR